MARTVSELSDSDLAFLTERHLATLTTLCSDGSPHVVAIAFTFDASTGRASVICSDETQKVLNVERDDRVVLCQVDGRRWLALEGTAAVRRDAGAVDSAVNAFEQRYRPASPNARRVVIDVRVDRVLGRA